MNRQLRLRDGKIKTAYWSLVGVVAALLVSTQTVFAADMWDRFSMIMKDIYGELVAISTIVGIIGAGTIPPNPSELLSSDRMKTFVAEIAMRYDYVIIDTPPINTVADAQILSAFVDGVLIVAKSGTTTSDELRAAVDAVERAEGNLCGVVLNDLNMKSMRYSYKYKYGGKYGDKYGYKYSYADPYERR